MNNQSFRSFLAIDLPEKDKDKVNKLINKLRDEISGDIKWVRKFNLHITLKFIRQFRFQDIRHFKDCLEASIRLIGNFEIRFNSLGVFPNFSKPRVIWFGLNYPEELSRIFQISENCCENLGYPRDERRFSPHLTLGRIKGKITNSQIKRIGQSISFFDPSIFSSFPVQSINFYQSDLTSRGPVYSRLFNVKLMI